MGCAQCTSSAKHDITPLAGGGIQLESGRIVIAKNIKRLHYGKRPWDTEQSDDEKSIGSDILFQTYEDLEVAKWPQVSEVKLGHQICETEPDDQSALDIVPKMQGNQQ